MSDPMTSTTAPAQQPYAADGTTISAAALATRIAALEAQIALAQRDNTKLIARIVELEHERDSARRGEVGAVHGRAEFRNAYRKARGERDSARKWAALWKAKANKERRKADNWQDSWLRAVGMAARLEDERDKARIVELEHQLETASGLIIRYARLVGSTIQAARETEEPTFVMDSVSSFSSLRNDNPTEMPMPAEDALSSVASQLAVMIIQERLNAGHTITFASDLAPPTQEGEDDE